MLLVGGDVCLEPVIGPSALGRVAGLGVALRAFGALGMGGLAPRTLDDGRIHEGDAFDHQSARFELCIHQPEQPRVQPPRAAVLRNPFPRLRRAQATRRR